MNQILNLQRQYGFTLQVEDPQSRWSTDPRRYLGIGRQYAALLGDTGKLMVDLNILSFRDRKTVLPFPTLIQTGTESYELIRGASKGAPRFCVYAEQTVNAQDLAFFPYAASGEVQYQNEGNGWTVESPHEFVLQLPPNIVRIDVDGSPVMSYRSDRFLIPAGSHRITVHQRGVGTFTSNELQTRLLSSTGRITSLVYGSRNLVLQYESSDRMLISLSNLPTAVTVDGVTIPLTVMNGNDCFSIFLPAGNHLANVLTGDQFTYGVSLTSFWSSTAIAIFGALAVMLIIIMYTVLKALKRSSGFQGT
jgi:hypothetical protein